MTKQVHILLQRRVFQSVYSITTEINENCHKVDRIKNRDFLCLCAGDFILSSDVRSSFNKGI